MSLGVQTSGPGSWACLDWRFLTADPELGRVALFGPCDQERAALRALGIACFDAGVLTGASVGSVGSASSGLRAETAVVNDSTVDLRQVCALLTDRGRIALRVTGAPLNSGLAGTLRPWSMWSRRLEARGFEVESAHWAYPDLARATFWVAVGDRRALALALRRQPASRRGRVLALAARVAARLGLAQTMSRQGIIVARRTGTAS